MRKEKKKGFSLYLKTTNTGTSLAAQGLRSCSSIAGATGLILGWGAKILHITYCGQKKKKKIHFLFYKIHNLCGYSGQLMQHVRLVDTESEHKLRFR